MKIEGVVTAMISEYSFKSLNNIGKSLYYVYNAFETNEKPIKQKTCVFNLIVKLIAF